MPEKEGRDVAHGFTQGVRDGILINSVYNNVNGVTAASPSGAKDGEEKDAKYAKYEEVPDAPYVGCFTALKRKVFGESGEDADDGASSEETFEGKREAVGYFDILFHNADRTDTFLILLGAFMAVGTGASLPLLTIFLGDTMNAFNNSGPDLPPGLTPSSSGILKTVGDQSLNLLYVGIAGFVAGSLNMFCWMFVGERITNHIRVSYVRALLRQEVKFYDEEVRENVKRHAVSHRWCHSNFFLFIMLCFSGDIDPSDIICLA